LSKVRVVLADLSPMLTSLITELIRSPEIEVITGRSGADLASLVADTAAAVVILPGEGNGMSQAGRQLLDDRARFRVIALSDHAQSGVLGDIEIRTMDLEDLSKSTLLRAITGRLHQSPVDLTSIGHRLPYDEAAPDPHGPGDPS
jgi:hypothetical protein